MSVDAITTAGCSMSAAPALTPHFMKSNFAALLGHCRQDRNAQRATLPTTCRQRGQSLVVSAMAGLPLLVQCRYVE
jgi:hypothetical protein